LELGTSLELGSWSFPSRTFRSTPNTRSLK
jgi:hypothetical protein